jgi:uncharacterized protein YpmB
MNKKTNYVVVIIVITFVVLLLAVYFLVFKKTDEPINVDATKVDTIEQ